MFANRFEPDGDGFIFRANLKAPGFRVSKAERDAFVAEFKRRSRMGQWGAAILIVPLIVAAIFALPSLFHVSADYAAVPVLGVTLPSFMIWSRWLWSAPARALQERTPDVEARSKEEALRLGFKRITWTQLGGAAALIPLMLLRVGYRHNLLVGWSRIWLVLAGALLLLLAVQAYRKWKSDNAGE